MGAHLKYDRRNFIKHAIWALPALHSGFLFRNNEMENDKLNFFDGNNRFKHIQLLTGKVEKQKLFYRDQLNLPIIEEASDSVTFQAGLTRMQFIEDNRGEAFYHFAFTIPTNKIEKAVNWMYDRAPLIHRPGIGEPVVFFKWLKAHSIYFFDPAGNIVEFIAHHRLNNARGGEFSMDDILFTSEIGLVTENVAMVNDELNASLGVDCFSDELNRASRCGDNFRLVGDLAGFFVVVRKNRTWLMTDLLAQDYPVNATVNSAKEAAYELKNTPCTIKRSKNH